METMDDKTVICPACGQALEPGKMTAAAAIPA